MAVIKHLSAENIEYLFGKIARESGIVDSTRSRCYIDNVAQLCDMDFVSDTTSFSELPLDTHYSSGVVYNNEIHLLGGYIDNDGHYIIKENGYEQLDNLPYNFQTSSGSAAVVYQDKIHILGSSASSSYYTKHFSLNGSTWTEESTLPYNFYNGNALIYNNKIHILGSNNSGNETKHYSWNGTSWNEESTLPMNFNSGSAVVYNNEIHILGGNTSPYTKHYKWNGVDWEISDTIPYAFLGTTAVVYDNKIHFLGSSYSTTTQSYHYTWDGTDWENVDTLPIRFHHAPALVKDDCIYLVGSYADGYQKMMYKYNGTQWTDIISIYRKLS